MRPAWAEVDLGAVDANIRTLSALVAPAAVCAVVKADGYGHGAAPVAQAAVGAGASWLAVALAEEGAALRDAGIDVPILLLSEPSPSELDLAIVCDLRPTLYTFAGVAAASRRKVRSPLPVHLKVDTGMHRVGAAPAEVLGLAKAIVEHPRLDLEAVWTHCARADEPDSSFTEEQLEVFGSVVDELAAAGIEPRMTHAANSAAAIAYPASRRDLVRIGIATYGIAPSAALAGRVASRPALSLKATVSLVKQLAAGEGVSYGHRHRLAQESVVATVPIGYADGVRRRLGLVGGEVLVGGERRPIVGVVTMDQLLVDCGPASEVQRGDEVVLIGRQGDEEITADEWATRLDTIPYEITCGIGPRVPAPVPVVSLTDVPGVRVGHWTDAEARTGCTVVLFPEGTVASGEVRGGAPATREFALLEPGRLVDRLDAVVLTGGSAFGLAAADGAVRFCEERGVGFPTGAGPVPIVVALAVFDLLAGDGSVRPGPDQGYAACEAAAAGAVSLGAVGAGTGATVGKWRGRDHARPAGLGGAALRHGDVVVAALVVVNAFGDVAGPPDGEVRIPPIPEAEPQAAQAFGNTTIGVVATNATLNKLECHLVAQSGHDGLARAIDPVHTRVDGDALVVAATGPETVPVDIVRILATAAVEQAARSAIPLA